MSLLWEIQTTSCFIFLTVDDDRENSVEMCLHEVHPLRNASENDEVITVADFRHIQRRFERKVDSMLCIGDLDFFNNCLAAPKYQRRQAHECTTGIPQKLG